MKQHSRGCSHLRRPSTTSAFRYQTGQMSSLQFSSLRGPLLRQIHQRHSWICSKLRREQVCTMIGTIWSYHRKITVTSQTLKTLTQSPPRARWQLKRIYITQTVCMSQLTRSTGSNFKTLRNSKNSKKAPHWRLLVSLSLLSGGWQRTRSSNVSTSSLSLIQWSDKLRKSKAQRSIKSFIRDKTTPFSSSTRMPMKTTNQN